MIFVETTVYQYNPTTNLFEKFKDFEFESTRLAYVTMSGNRQYFLAEYDPWQQVELYQIREDLSFERVPLTEQFNISAEESIKSFEMNAEENLLAISTTLGSYLYSYDNASVELLMNLSEPSSSAKFSWDGKLLVVAGEQGLNIFVEDSSPECEPYCVSCDNSSCSICNELMGYNLNESSGQCF